MKKSASIMGMPVTVEIRDKNIEAGSAERVFNYLKRVDAQYSPFKETSEVSRYNRGEKASPGMKKILVMAEDLKKKTNGYFDIKKSNGQIDPSGIVKGWAIKNAANILRNIGYKRFYVDAGGDAEIIGGPWKWGIRNPFNIKQIVKVLWLSDCGIATSGTYERGQHIYDPVGKKPGITDIVSLTVIGPDVLEADKYSTPAFAMGRSGIKYIESFPGLEGYMIDTDGIATMTTGFGKYILV